jgi:hypothetical protein
VNWLSRCGACLVPQRDSSNTTSAKPHLAIRSKLSYISAMTPRSKTNKIDAGPGAARAETTVISGAQLEKAAKPVSNPPEVDDFVAELLVTDKIILDHLAK